MAGPITWRSLQPSADPSAGVALMGMAQRSLQGALDPFQKILQQQNAAGAEQAGMVREGNKQAFLQALQAAGSPEALEALKQSGELEAFRAKLTPDSIAAVRGAEDARLTGLRQQVVAGQQYEAGQVAQLELPVEQNVAKLIALRKFPEARKIATSSGLTNPAPLLSGIAAAEDSLAARVREEIRFAREGTAETRKAEAHTTEQTARQATIAANEAARDLATQQLELAQKNAAAEAENKLMADGGNVYAKEGIFTPGDTVGITEFMVKNGIGNDADARAEIVKRLTALGSEMELDYVNGDNKMDKKKVPIPLALVKQAILGATGGEFFNSDNDFADSVEKNLRKGMKSVAESTLPDGRVHPQSKTVMDFDQYMRGRINLSKNPPAVGVKKPKQ